MIAMLASAIGWQLGNLAGPIVGFFTSVFCAAAGLYLARRWLAERLG
jgi:hypothetical protein